MGKQDQLKINPNSVPGKVLTERKKNPGPLGSRSNPWPEGTPAWKKGGFKNQKEYEKAVKADPRIRGWLE